ncbi:MAG: gliding motility-associated C-terminal domain-containing protein [Saprospiraceae bacterium]|nr:gliding motility-associated C-terminal domain-containing protein [Saprospiraceae bacterium]
MIFKKSTFSYLAGILLFSLISMKAIAQSPFPTVIFNVTSAMGDTGDQVCLEFTVSNFTSVEAFQLNISYNSNLVIPDCPPDLSGSALFPNISGSSFNCTKKDNGYINIVWFDNPVSLPDGSNLFTICFDIIGNPGNSTPVFFNGLITPIEICQSGPNNETFCTETISSNSGVITIKSNTLQGFFNKCDADGINVLDNGNLTFYATGGTAPYSYSINGGLYTGTGVMDGERVTIDPIPMNTYNIVITDALGANITIGPITVSDNVPITYDTPIEKNTSCANLSNGFIVLRNIQGGTSPYRYSWSNFIAGVSNDSIRVDNLESGTYKVTITDFGGCVRTDSFTLSIDTLRLDVTIIPASCADVNNGRIILNATGGTPFSNGQYQYSLNNGTFFKFSNGFALNNRPTGPINLRVTDSLSCLAIFEPIFIPFERTLVAQTDSIKNVSCFGAADGTAQISITPLTNYLFTFEGETVGNIGNTFTTPPVGPGNYTINARDLQGCRASVSFQISEPDKLELNPTIVQPNCTPSGSITLNPTGGTGTYRYNWSPAAPNTNQLSNISGGTFRVTVTDDNNCSDSLSIVLNSGGTLNINARIISTLSCNNQNNASATVEINSPNFPTISWTNEAGTTISNMQTISNLGPGRYYVRVSEAGGCENTDSILITNPLPISFSIISTQPTCAGFNNGSLGVNASGGTGTLSYEWRRSGSGLLIGAMSVLAPVRSGSYYVIVRDSNGCIKDSTVVLTDPAKLEPGDPEVIEVRCFGQAVGRARMLDLSLNYLWSDGGVTFFTTNLPAGTNWVIANDGTCVSDTVFFNVPTVSKITIDRDNTVVVTPSCFDSSDGTISMRATGGVSTVYTYNWPPPLSRSGADIDNLREGIYVVEITDSFGCTVVDSVSIQGPDELEVSINTLQTIELSCKNQDQGQIALLTTGGNQGLKTYQWDNGQTSTGPVISNLTPGTYCATVTDVKGCEDRFCYTLEAPAPLIGQVNTPVLPKCFGDTTCISIGSVTGGTGNRYTFQINQGPRIPIGECVTVYAGPYLINIIDSAGCSIDTMINISQPLPVSVDLGEDIEIQLGTTSSVINATITAPAGVQSLIWNPEETLLCLTSDCETIEVSPLTTTLYRIFVTDNNGCTGVDDIEVRVKDTRNVFFANVFSPNGDGVNDYFQVVTGPGVEQVKSFAVFDRWGNQVFFRENYMPDEAGTDGWNGTFGGRALDPGVFVYYAKVLFADQRELTFSGSVTLLDKRRN